MSEFLYGRARISACVGFLIILCSVIPKPVCSQQFERFEVLPEDCSLLISFENTGIFEEFLGRLATEILTDDALKDLCSSENFLLDFDREGTATSVEELFKACSMCDHLRICIRCNNGKTEFALLVYGAHDNTNHVIEASRKIEGTLPAIDWGRDLFKLIQEQFPFASLLINTSIEIERCEMNAHNFVVISNSRSLIQDIERCIANKGKGSLGKNRRFQRVYSRLQSTAPDVIAYLVPSDFADSIGEDFSVEMFQSYGYDELLGAGMSLTFGQLENFARPLVEAEVYVPYTLPENELIQVFKTYRNIDKWPDLDVVSQNDEFELVYLKASNRDWESYIQKRQELFEKADDSELYEKKVQFLIDKMGGKIKYLSAYNGNLFFFRLFNENENSIFPVSLTEHAGEDQVQDFLNDMISRVSEGSELVPREIEINGCKAWFMSDDDAKKQHEINFGKDLSGNVHVENYGTVLTDKSIWSVDKRLFETFFQDSYNLKTYDPDRVFPGYHECFGDEEVVQIELFWSKSFFPMVYQTKYRLLVNQYGQDHAGRIALGENALLGDSVSDDGYRVINVMLDKIFKKIDRAALGFSLPDDGLKWHFSIFGKD